MNMNKDLLIVDDDVPFRDRLKKSMEKKGFFVEAFSDSKSTLGRMENKKFDFAIVDMKLNDGSGLELIKFSQTASAVNEITVTNAVAGDGPSITATGGDNNIDLSLSIIIKLRPKVFLNDAFQKTF